MRIKILTLSILLLFSLAACNLERKEDFGIYLEDTGELMLWEKHIKAYNANENTFELNADGIKRWNSYQKYKDIPKLADSLFQRRFILKIEGREICRGTFWSYASSASYSGVVILDSLFTLDAEHNLLWIRSEYPGATGKLDPLIGIELESFFKEQGKLK